MSEFTTVGVEAGFTNVGATNLLAASELQEVAAEAQAVGRRECVALQLCRLNVLAKEEAIIRNQAGVLLTCRQPDCSITAVGAAAQEAKQLIGKAIEARDSATMSES
jgi:hypothetical protein